MERHVCDPRWCLPVPFHLAGRRFDLFPIGNDAIWNPELTGAFFFIVMNQTFSAANPTLLAVPLELPIVMREYKGGLYHLVAWYVAKNVSDLPMQILLLTVFFVPAYLLMGIGHGFFSMLLVIILVNSSAVGLAYMVSCMVQSLQSLAWVILPFLLFGGLFINSANCPEYFIWVQYISPIKYGFEALMKSSGAGSPSFRVMPTSKPAMRLQALKCCTITECKVVQHSAISSF